MKHARLESMVKGWFVGDFDPSVLKTDKVEVAVKYYTSGQKEEAHFHRIATEITVVVSGSVRMLGRVWNAGDIVTVDPNEVTDFEALTDSINVVVKMPSLTNDKFPESNSFSGAR